LELIKSSPALVTSFTLIGDLKHLVQVWNKRNLSF